MNYADEYCLYEWPLLYILELASWSITMSRDKQGSDDDDYGNDDYSMVIK